jgi:hypothetical protein
MMTINNNTVTHLKVTNKAKINITKLLMLTILLLHLTADVYASADNFPNLAELPYSNGDVAGDGSHIGLQLFLNDILAGNLQHQSLAHQYFSIWLGGDPFEESVKQDLPFK